MDFCCALCYDSDIRRERGRQMPQYFKHSYKSSAAGLPLVVKNVGFQQCTPGYHWGAGMRDHYLLHYVVSGKGTYTLNGSSYPVHAGQVFLVWPNTLVRYCADESDPWEYYWLGFTGPDAAALAAQSGIRPEAPVRSVGFGRSIQQYITAIYDARGQSVWSRTQMLGYAYLLLGKLVEGQSEPENRSDCVEKAAEFLSNNYADQITIDDAAAFAGISRSWLYRGFQRRYGKSPLAYLEELRMQYAAQLLRTTALRVNEIACSVGYLDALYFSRAFSRRMGLSPTAYRAAGLPSTDAGL